MRLWSNFTHRSVRPNLVPPPNRLYFRDHATRPSPILVQSIKMGVSSSTPRSAGPPKQELSLSCGLCGKPALVFESFVSSGPIHELCTTQVSEMCAFLAESSDMVRCQTCAMKKREADEREARQLERETAMLNRQASQRSNQVYSGGGSLGRNGSRRSLLSRLRDSWYDDDDTEVEDDQGNRLRRQRSVRFAPEPRRQASMDSIQPEPQHLLGYQPDPNTSQQTGYQQGYQPQAQETGYQPQNQQLLVSAPPQPPASQQPAYQPMFPPPPAEPTLFSTQPQQPGYQPQQQVPHDSTMAQPPQNPTNFNFGAQPPDQPRQAPPPLPQLQTQLDPSQHIQVPHSSVSPPTQGNLPRNFSPSPQPTPVPHGQSHDISYQGPPQQQPQDRSYQPTTYPTQNFSSANYPPTNYPPTNYQPTNYPPPGGQQQSQLSMPESPLDRLRQERDASRAHLEEVERRRQEQERTWAEQDRLSREARKNAKKAQRVEEERQRKENLRNNRPPPRDNDGSTRQPKKTRSAYAPVCIWILMIVMESMLFVKGYILIVGILEDSLEWRLDWLRKLMMHGKNSRRLNLS